MLKNTLSAIGFVVLFFAGGMLFATVMDQAMSSSPVLAGPGFLTLFVVLVLFSALQGTQSQ